VSWLAVLLGLIAVLLLREMWRGAPAQVPRPRWSAGFVGLWVLCSGAVMACFFCEYLWRGYAVAGHAAGVLQAMGAADGNSLIAALLVGFVVAASVSCARWAFCALAGWCRTPVAAAVRGPAGVTRAELPVLPRQAPVADGWSSRGPPLMAAVTFS
jgi:hypothetical protein